MTGAVAQISSTESHRRGAQLGYRPALDGLRAVAVVAVMLYHGGVPGIAGGFLGVDVFLVLSGFLITSLLIREWHRTGRIDLKAFWLRRARRLLPAILAVLLAVAVYFWAISAQQPLLRGDSLATLGYVSNWWFIRTGQSYFAQFVEPSPLRHTWSLAIEEQFYIVFPVVLVLLLGRARIGMRPLRAILGAGVIGSAALMAILYVPFTDPSRVYYGTDTRLQALLLGALLAVIPSMTRPSQPVFARVAGHLVRFPGATVLGWLALGGLMTMFFAARELAPWMYQGGFLLAAALSALVIVAVSRSPRSSLGRLLSWRPIVAVGIVSYGLYLWHWPVFVALNHERSGLSGWGLLFARFALTGLLAYVSFKCIEEPIRTQRLQRRFTPTQWARAATAATVVVAGALIVTTGSSVSNTLMPQTRGVIRPSPVPDADGRLTTVFLLGDSQSFSLRSHYRNQIDGIAVTGSTQLGCGTLLAERRVDGQTFPNLPACGEWEPRWVEEVARESPDVVVLMLGLGELYDRWVDGRVLTFGTSDYRAWLYREIDHRRKLVAAHSDRFALTTVLCIGISADAADRHAQAANDPHRLSWLNDTIVAYGSEHPGVEILDVNKELCPRGYTEQVNGTKIRDDGLHLNQAGSDLFWSRFESAITDPEQ